MKTNEFKDAMKKLGLSRQELATALGMSDSMMRLYENGVNVIPRTVQLALEALETRKKNGKPILSL